MDEYLETLIEAFLRGEPGSRSALIVALRNADAPTWIGAAMHARPEVRELAAVAAVYRSEPDIREMLRQLADDAERSVRFALARVAASSGGWSPGEAVVSRLLEEDDTEIFALAVRAAARLPSLADRLIIRVEGDTDPDTRDAIVEAFVDAGAGLSVSVLFRLVAAVDAAEDGGADVAKVMGVLERVLTEVAPDGTDRPQSGHSAATSRAFDRLGLAGRMPRLAAYLDSLQGPPADAARGGDEPKPIPQPKPKPKPPTAPARPATSDGAGIDLTAEARAGRLERALHRDSLVERIVRLVAKEDDDSRRSIALLGASGVGKTAVVHEVVHRLAEAGIRVVQLTGYDVMVGTRYLGEWETRLRQILDGVRAEGAILYMPGFDQLITTGMSTGGQQNVADMLAPYLERGDVLVIGEATLEAYRHSIGRMPHLDRLFTQIEVPQLTADETADVAHVVAAASGVELDDTTMSRVIELADDYLHRFENPDRAIRLLRGALDVGGDHVDERALLEFLHASTGIPVDFLDEHRALDLQAIRHELQEQVMGQPEAVDAVLDVVTLIKAGLTDPDRPNGVMLFVGPTGVGKTELARSLARLLFGDADRLLRLDMSEYATFPAFERLIGAGASRTAHLTDAVRDQPFSVILLDEIEKAHANVYDLCLQLFDAGRLTDGLNRTVDFRSTIVIMTSNVGASFSGAGVGFVTQAEPPNEAAIRRSLEQHFRPEFLNRIDHIVPFRPLDVEVAERITRREIARGLERRGLSRRDISVEVDGSLVALLLTEGYSEAYGARPLRRVVERLVLGPLAREIASGKAGREAVLRLTAKRGRLVVRRVGVDVDAAAGEPVADIVELDVLRERLETIRERTFAVQERKADLLEVSARPGFWDDRSSALETLDVIHRLDRVLSDVRRLERDVERTERNPNPGRRAVFVASHHREAGRLEFLLEAGDLADAFIVLRTLRQRGEPLDGVERLAGMYRGLARRRRLEVDVFDDRIASDEVTATLMIGGTGAFALLQGETGLHRLTRRAPEGSRGDVELVRVDVLRAPVVAGFAGGEVTTEVKALKGAEARVAAGRLRLEVHAFHRPSKRSVTVRSGAGRDEAREHAQLLLRAHLDRPEEGEPNLIRRYTFGRSPMVKDLATGRSTGRVSDVFGGAIDEFLLSGHPAASKEDE